MGKIQTLQQLKRRYKNNKGIVQGLEMAMDVIRVTRGQRRKLTKMPDDSDSQINVTSQDIVTLNHLKQAALKQGKDERAAFYHKLKEVAKQYKKK